MKTGNVFAANPDALRAKPANGIEQLYPRGTLDSISIPADVKNLVNGNTFTIQFVISGKCRIDFAPGDGSASVRFEVGSDGGKNQSVPVEKTYTYNTTFSSASQAFKPVKMQFKTVSPCVNNAPTSQTMVDARVQAPIKQDILSSAPGLGMKRQRPGATELPH